MGRSSGEDGPALSSVERESSDGVERFATPKIGFTRGLLRTGASSSLSVSGCGARRRFPKGEFLSPDIFVGVYRSLVVCASLDVLKYANE